MATAELEQRLTRYVKSETKSVSTEDATFISACLDQSVALVDAACGAAIVSVPIAVLHGAYVEVGAELYQRQTTKNGITQFASPDGTTAVRVRADPLAGVRSTLALFLPGGFA